MTLSQDHVDVAHGTKSISVLVASLHEIFYKGIREFYLNHPTTDGHHVGVYTASHEEDQVLKSLDHDKKALVDMYLLSFSDTLVTSAWSTFGYVAQGISGVTPWIFTKLDSAATVEEVIRKQGHCFHGVSIEPCFHSAPTLDCDNKGWGSDPGKTHPYIQHCEDVSWGIKIMDKATFNASS